MPDPITIGMLGLLLLFGLLILRMPVGIAMITVGVGGTWVLSLVVGHIRFVPYLRQFKSLLWENVANYDLSVVPLFVLMGYIAAEARLSSDLFKGLEALLSRLRGGVAMAAVAACGGFGAVCGSSLATAATMGKVALPELKALGYSPRLASGALAAGGTLGILIPPSVALVIYAIIVEGSILKMFQAAVLPGLLAVLGFILVIAVLVRLNPTLAPAPRPMEREARRIAIRRLVPVIAIFSAIILGLGFGLFTPTPAASIGVFVITVYGFVLRGVTGEGLTLSGLLSAIRSTAITAGMIYLILFGAEVLKGFFTRTGLPQALSDWAATSGLDPMSVLIIMLVIFIVLGCFMESLAMILVVVPFFWPTLIALNGGDFVTADSAAFGMDNDSLKIWFGILALIVVELGLITPPVGLNVFIISSLAKDTPMATVFRGVLPFLAAEFVRVGLILMIPALTLIVPRLIGH
ncbi:C4-dicarboxylate TRAP transporter large permease protein DctM [Defluviimonas aquaemixtae]|uniref:C4-dicarboxylate TRAP transporter large permease protein DctM n=1 Tax=Albidovulum aquaemixtae TaxID=1542388 RepID=A0A2R8B879_9RHOB|nr:TRAP transporter large permease [Defluviimonas aquaemixtae]SPH18837.1 C4-dicarboxylate TRAP transporter large permease protein DctM [Defluviimonas aquaemixtae]